MEESQKEKIEEDAVEKVAEELKIQLPKTNLPTILKLIALFTLIGGLSIVGSVFADIVSPRTGFGLYILRIFIGIAAIAVAYGIIERKRWAVWFYGFIVLLGLILNPAFALLPLAITVYLYFKRRLFEPSIFDRVANIILKELKVIIGKING